jgi:hypothetical protein
MAKNYVVESKLRNYPFFTFFVGAAANNYEIKRLNPREMYL